MNGMYSTYLIAEVARMEQQRLADLEPCPVCGGDKLRPNYDPDLAFASTRPCHVRPQEPDHA